MAYDCHAHISMNFLLFKIYFFLMLFLKLFSFCLQHTRNATWHKWNRFTVCVCVCMWHLNKTLPARVLHFKWQKITFDDFIQCVYNEPQTREILFIWMKSMRTEFEVRGNETIHFETVLNVYIWWYFNAFRRNCLCSFELFVPKSNGRIQSGEPHIRII